MLTLLADLFTCLDRFDLIFNYGICNFCLFVSFVLFYKIRFILESRIIMYLTITKARELL